MFRSRSQRVQLALLVALLPLAAVHVLRFVADRSVTVCSEKVEPGSPMLPQYVPCVEAGEWLPWATWSSDYLNAQIAYSIGSWSPALGLLVLYPELALLAEAPRKRLTKRWKAAGEAAALAAACAAIAWFTLHFGNRYFGGFDFSILIESGWRLLQGQLPYRDFPCLLPPGFYLGSKFALLLFGVRWNAILWASALYSGATFLWIYTLLKRLLAAPVAAFCVAVCIESCGMLLLCFWWYNNITSVAAVVFLLSCLAYLRDERSTPVQGMPEKNLPEKSMAVPVSYVASLALLGLMKPNVASLGCVSGVLLVGFGVRASLRARGRFVALTLLAIALNVGILWTNHVSVTEMVRSYFAAAGERGQDPAFGFRNIRIEEIERYVVLTALLLIPWRRWWPRWKTSKASGDRARIAECLLLLAAPITAAVAMFTNGEFKEVEWPLILAAASILLYDPQPLLPAPSRRTPPLASAAPSGRLVRVYAAVLCAILASNIYIGAERIRVYSVGWHRFFEWHEDFPATTDAVPPFFAGMQGSRRFQRMLDELRQALRENNGTIYFGPRMEFAYAMFGLPSPRGLPIWWDPGTSFPASQEGVYENVWFDSRFQTLILSKRDTTYYSWRFLKRWESLYIEDKRFPELTILRRKKN